VTFPAWKLGAVTFGKNKESFSCEMVGDAANLPPLERILTPFFTSRNVGVLLSNTAFDKRMTISGGWANDWWITGQKFDDSSNHFSSRITGLASASEEGSRYLHVGLSGRYTGAVRGAVQLKGKAGSNVTSLVS
jgi:phosphate-selective porin OprO/OprP